MARVEIQIRRNIKKCTVAFAVRLKKPCILCYPKCAQQTLTHMSEGTFSHDSAQISVPYASLKQYADVIYQNRLWVYRYRHDLVDLLLLYECRLGDSEI